MHDWFMIVCSLFLRHYFMYFMYVPSLNKNAPGGAAQIRSSPQGLKKGLGFMML